MILIEHLAVRRGFGGEVVKTVSGSDLIPRVAALHQLPVFETPIGYKYSGSNVRNPGLAGWGRIRGIGYGTHIPERDALLSALYVLEAITKAGMDLSDLYRVQNKLAHSAYDRIDLPARYGCAITPPRTTAKPTFDANCWSAGGRLPHH